MSKSFMPATHCHVITGGFGSGKTTAIRRLMSDKPPHELWVVILNEFTDAGIDAVSVAAAACGSFDVRLVAGGCLCCVGELEFGKQLRDILRTLRPVRLLIEPSGAAHAADIVDQLAAYEAQGALTLDSTVCLVDAIDAVRLWDRKDPIAWSQVQSADVLLMSKSDLAGDVQRSAFDAIAAAQYPAKAYVGSCTGGLLPGAALLPYAHRSAFTLLQPAESASHLTTAFPIAGLMGSESRVSQLGLHAIAWVLPAQLTFARVEIESRLHWLLETYSPWLRRFKAVFRTGPGPSLLLQSHGRGLDAEDSAYRRDSRVELVIGANPEAAFLDSWRAMLRAAALPHG